MITAERLRELLHYDPNTGFFTRKAPRRGTVVGDIAGGRHPAGYVAISLARGRYLAHRLAWLYVHGKFPGSAMDHINGIKDDNRIANLRVATMSQNLANRSHQRNSKSGVKGIHWREDARKWRAMIHVLGRTSHIGYFDTREEASEAYCAAAKKHFGEFASTA